MRHARVFVLAGLAVAVVTAAYAAQTTVVPIPDNEPVETAPLEVDLGKTHWGDAEAGQAKAATCAACHGPDGKGNPILGAPDLTDAVWLYGSDFATISEGIRNGRAGMMPAHEPILGELRSRLVGAYVWSLSHGSEQAVSSGAP